MNITEPVTWEHLLVEAAENLKDSGHKGCDRKSVPCIADALGRCLQSFIDDAVADPEYFLRHHGSEFYRWLATKPNQDEEMEVAA